ncbi:MAG: EcsC family protein [Cytophagales bacterium]|nr:EcsC family protein [Cytophagales bacterium]
MSQYEQDVLLELARWQKEMKQRPSFFNKLSKGMQTRVNKIIPEKVHQVFTTAIKQMVRGVLAGSGFINPKPLHDLKFLAREMAAREKIKVYRNTATAEGAITGAGGFLLGLADFPLWLTVKIKMLFEIAAVYGYDVNDFKERLYILHIFQLTFSSQKGRQQTYAIMEGWDEYSATLPTTMQEFDWRNFQQEYRDYIDLAKLLQLVPGIGAVVGAYVNHKLTEKLGEFAMMAYRMRVMNAPLKKLQSKGQP